MSLIQRYGPEETDLLGETTTRMMAEVNVKVGPISLHSDHCKATAALNPTATATATAAAVTTTITAAATTHGAAGTGNATATATATAAAATTAATTYDAAGT